jgi:hypothetical protein
LNLDEGILKILLLPLGFNGEFGWEGWDCKLLKDGNLKLTIFLSLMVWLQKWWKIKGDK